MQRGSVRGHLGSGCRVWQACRRAIPLVHAQVRLKVLLQVLLWVQLVHAQVRLKVLLQVLLWVQLVHAQVQREDLGCNK